jgi:hypothetical protein
VCEEVKHARPAFPFGAGLRHRKRAPDVPPQTEVALREEHVDAHGPADPGDGLGLLDHLVDFGRIVEQQAAAAVPLGDLLVVGAPERGADV